MSSSTIMPYILFGILLILNKPNLLNNVRAHLHRYHEDITQLSPVLPLIGAIPNFLGMCSFAIPSILFYHPSIIESSFLAPLFYEHFGNHLSFHTIKARLASQLSIKCLFKLMRALVYQTKFKSIYPLHQYPFNFIVPFNQVICIDDQSIKK